MIHHRRTARMKIENAGGSSRGQLLTLTRLSAYTSFNPQFWLVSLQVEPAVVTSFRWPGDRGATTTSAHSSGFDAQIMMAVITFWR